MTATFQPSLLDLGANVTLGPLGPTVRRTRLEHGAWIDLRPGWLAGADILFQRLVDSVPWYEERRRMYDRMVDVPRLLKFYDEDEPLPDPALDEARRALDDRYAAELGEPFRTVGMCYYRDGRDSVAWHGDTIEPGPRTRPQGRGSDQDTMVAILSVGDPRALLLRPRGGGPVVRHELGHGDLIVMGGSCQRTWEHAIPKTARPVGPRISIQYRPRGVR